jgi:hypothetical protein
MHCVAKRFLKYTSKALKAKEKPLSLFHQIYETKKVQISLNGEKRS